MSASSAPNKQFIAIRLDCILDSTLKTKKNFPVSYDPIYFRNGVSFFIQKNGEPFFIQNMKDPCFEKQWRYVILENFSRQRYCSIRRLRGSSARLLPLEPIYHVYAEIVTATAQWTFSMILCSEFWKIFC